MPRFRDRARGLHSTDISHTYNYNHYGTSKITEDNSDPAHPLCIIRWESAKNPDGSWAAYTAIPCRPDLANQRPPVHQPERQLRRRTLRRRLPQGADGAVRYHWLLDDGNGNLVSRATGASFDPHVCLLARLSAAQVAGLQAAIEAPEPPEFHPKEFGPAVWVKEIRTTSHNNNKVKLRDLVSDDPDDDEDINWRNGEPDEVEVEWQILQTEFGAGRWWRQQRARRRAGGSRRRG